MISQYAILFANAPMLGQASHALLAAAFPTLEDAWKATRSELLASGLTEKRVDAFLTWKSEHGDMNYFPSLMEKNAIRLVGLHDEEYPPLLATIFDPPAFLFVKGAHLIREKLLAMVGSRKATTYGLEAAHVLAKDIARGGIAIVSGGAYGIDVAAHDGAISASGTTIAVLGSGLLGSDTSRQTNVMKRILDAGGTLVSEFPLLSPPLPHHFPLRNRIVAGLCEATLLVEAGLPSGSMITADCATRENRDVCAVPGNISSKTSFGTNYLLKNGAHCVTEAQDIFLLYGMHVAKHASATTTLSANVSANASALFATLGAEPLHIDAASARAHLSPSAAGIAATELEILGVIRDIGGKQFVVNA